MRISAPSHAIPSVTAIWLIRLGLMATLGFAFWLAFYSGTRGIFPLDQSIVFDGGYRVASGQVIYRDFVAPSGPLVYWLQGAVFKLFGVSYRVYILTAAGYNALAAAGVLDRGWDGVYARPKGMS